MDVLITGGMGYIGSVLLPLLQRHTDIERVGVLDDFSTGSPRTLVDARLNGSIDIYRGDVREYGDVEDAVNEFETIIHLAAITGADSTHDRREETFAVNLEGTRNVLSAAEKHGLENVVFASSCNLYGRAASEHIDEIVDPDPLNPYAESKLAAEQLLTDYIAESEMSGTGLRLSTVYGNAPGMRFNLVINHFVFRALTGRPLTVYGNGTNWRPFIHVRDAAWAFLEAIVQPTNWPQDIYNVGTNSENYRISEIADIVHEEVAPVEITYLKEKHPGPSYHVNFDRLSETGFTPKHTVPQGVRQIARKFRG